MSSGVDLSDLYRDVDQLLDEVLFLEVKLRELKVKGNPVVESIEKRVSDIVSDAGYDDYSRVVKAEIQGLQDEIETLREKDDFFRGKLEDMTKIDNELAPFQAEEMEIPSGKGYENSTLEDIEMKLEEVKRLRIENDELGLINYGKFEDVEKFIELYPRMKKANKIKSDKPEEFETYLRKKYAAIEILNITETFNTNTTNTNTNTTNHVIRR